MERPNFGGVSEAGKLTGDNAEDGVVAGSHWVRTLRALTTFVSCTADSRAKPRLNDPSKHIAKFTSKSLTANEQSINQTMQPINLRTDNPGLVNITKITQKLLTQ